MRSSKSRSRNKNRNRPQGGGNIVNRVFDSSGPEGKVRGTPAQIIEKYNQLARDAQLSNDRVALENFQQHSEHYTRMLAAAQKELDARQQQGGGQQPQEDRQGGHGGYGAQGGNGNQGQQVGQHQQDRRGDPTDQPARLDGSQAEAGGHPGEPSQREGQGRRGNRRRERGEERAPQDGATDVIEPAEADTGPVPTPEGDHDAPRGERPKRARTRRKAPAPTGEEGERPAAPPVIDDSAA